LVPPDVIFSGHSASKSTLAGASSHTALGKLQSQLSPDY